MRVPMVRSPRSPFQRRRLTQAFAETFWRICRKQVGRQYRWRRELRRKEADQQARKRADEQTRQENLRIWWEDHQNWMREWSPEAMGQ